MIRSIYFPTKTEWRTGLAVEEFPAALQDEDGLLWVDFEGTPPDEDEPILRQVFGFHPLAVDDALQESHVPKLDDWVDYLYIVLHAVVYDKEEGDHVDTLELDVFLGKNFLITHHDEKITALDHVMDACQRDERFMRNGVSHMFYRLADEVVASYMPVVEELDIAIDMAEDQVFNNPTSATLEHIFKLKRAVLHLRRIIGPQREVLNKLARDEYLVIGPKERVYFRDIYDHLVRLYDITDSIRDLVSGTLDTYLSVINNRMNDIMKTLTVITTMFMPIAFITGFFGMNFFVAIPPYSSWTEQPVFILMLSLMVIIPFSMLTWIRRKGWL